MRPAGATVRQAAASSTAAGLVSPPRLAVAGGGMRPASASRAAPARPRPATTAAAPPGTVAGRVLESSSSGAAPQTPAPTTCLKSLPYDDLASWVASTGEPPATVAARTKQLWRLLYYKDTKTGVGLVGDLASEAGPGIQGGLGAAFLERAASAGASTDPGIELDAIYTSADGTRKLVFNITTGPAAGRKVDAVLIPVVRAGGRPRLTLCISSQAGCAQGCTFCLTGAMGLGGSLTAGQIVEQAVVARRLLAAEAAEAAADAEEAGGDTTATTPPRQEAPPPPLVKTLTNVVLMGQGEPLDNLASVADAVTILSHPLGLAFGASKITLSTVGLLGPLRTFARAHPRVQLALSLHATTDAGRAAIMPAAARPGHDLAAVAACLRELFPDRKEGEGASSDSGERKGGGSGHRRHILIEYLLLDGVNDSPDDARRLLALLDGVAAKINLLNFNPHAEAVFGRSGRGDAFRTILVEGGRVCTVRASRGGDDAMAACGQLGDPGAAGGVVAKARLARLLKTGV